MGPASRRWGQLGSLAGQASGRASGSTPPPGALRRAERAEGAERPPAARRPEVARPTTTWAGRFAEAPAPDAAAFTHSLPFDHRLIVQDLTATAAHVDALHRAGLLDDDERERLAAEVQTLLQRAGEFPFLEQDEDVHSAVERVLTERLGPLGAKVHAGRSRNDLVATDLRLWIREASGDLAGRARALAEALAARAEEHPDALIPGYTHLQRGQPVTLAHHLLAHAWPLARDAERLDRAAGRAAGSSPLGAGALATSTLGLDPGPTGGALGFDEAFENSIDAVADRDFALEFLSACTITAVHLSRLAEDLVLWSSAEFGFARVDDRYATGSSMMPQKRNPDVAELARAKAGRVLGDLVALATTMKGLPLAYDRDLQEDKPAVFDAYDQLGPALDALRGTIETISFDTDRMRAACEDGFVLATDVAEALVRLGHPFREAHESVAKLVSALDADRRTLADVTDEEWTALDPRLQAEMGGQLTPEASVGARSGPGGPAPGTVARQIAALRSALGKA